MKKIFYFLLSIFLITYACKPSSERDDAKYLGIWKGNSLFDTGDGTYNYVTITLSGDNEFPYRVTMFQYNGESKKSSEWESKMCKIHDGYLFTQENNVHGFSFKILEKEGKFNCYSDRYHVVGPLKNHTK